MKRTCQKLCGHITEDAERVLTALGPLTDAANGLNIAQAALKLRDAIAAIRQAAVLVEQARHEGEDFPP